MTNTAKPFTLTKDSFAFPQLNDLGESVELPEINMGHAGPRLCSPKAFRTPETILARPLNEKNRRLDGRLVYQHCISISSKFPTLVPIAVLSPTARTKLWAPVVLLRRHFSVLHLGLTTVTPVKSCAPTHPTPD